MKHIPISINKVLIPATALGLKTQTRRTVKSKNCHPKCPYGEPGDLLWVREEHLITYDPKAKKWIIEYADGFVQEFYYKELSLQLNKRLIKRKTLGKWQRARFLPKAFARLFLLVKDVDVERLKDISEKDAISEGVEECLPFTGEYRCYLCRDNKSSKEICFYHDEYDGWITAKESFMTLWLSINGPGSWDANPEVFKISFERTEKPANWPNQ